VGKLGEIPFILTDSSSTKSRLATGVLRNLREGSREHESCIGEREIPVAPMNMRSQMGNISLFEGNYTAIALL
jgi:hypothetical protein